MKAIAITLAMILATVAHAAAPGAFFSGNELRQLIRGKPADRVQAYLYIAGVLDATQGLQHCAPVGVTLEQATDLVAITLQRSPEHRHESAHLYVTATMAGMYPCAKGGSV